MRIIVELDDQEKAPRVRREMSDTEVSDPEAHDGGAPSAELLQHFRAVTPVQESSTEDQDAIDGGPLPDYLQEVIERVVSSQSSPQAESRGMPGEVEDAGSAPAS